MAGEAGRIIKRKNVQGIDIPVITQITFNDVPERGQDTQFTIDNTSAADRTVRVASIIDDKTTDESGGGNGLLDVERIDQFKVLDDPSRGQESFFQPDSKTVQEPPDAPPYFITHTKT